MSRMNTMKTGNFQAQENLIKCKFSVRRILFYNNSSAFILQEAGVK